MNLSVAKAVDRYAGMAVCRALAALRFVRELIAPRQEPVRVRSILCMKFWGLGNIVLILPVLRRLRERHPEARIVFVSLARNRELLDTCPWIDRRIYIDDAGPLRLVLTYVAACWRAHGEHPDLALDFEQFARASSILAVLARAKQLAGLDTPGQGRSVLYHKLVRYDDSQHMSRTFHDVGRAAGVTAEFQGLEPFPRGARAKAAASALLEELPPGGPLVVLHPGSGDNFQGRRWPAQAFARLADRLIREHGARVVVSGSRGETPLAEEVIARMEEPRRVLSAAGRLSILSLAEVIARADALVTNDTAPVHLGSALGTAVFALFGPNTPRLYGPLSEGSHSFYRALPCSPCLTNMNYKTSRCRLPVCITDIPVSDVYSRVSAHLAARAARHASGSGA